MTVGVDATDVQIDVAGMVECQSSNHHDGGFLSQTDGPSGELAGVSNPSSSNGGLNATLGQFGHLPESPDCRWRISDSNESLPHSPVLDGLLKPS